MIDCGLRSKVDRISNILKIKKKDWAENNRYG